MFTGIIERIGKVVKIDGSREDGFYMTIEPLKPMDDLKIGDSISVSGACLTITELKGEKISIYLSRETLTKTRFGDINLGNIVNLENSLSLKDKISGHIVLGHIDGVGVIRAMRQVGRSIEMMVGIDSNLIKYISIKGSIAVEGISLTITEVNERSFKIVLIPYTIENTNLKYMNVGDMVNIEVDIVARYIEKLIRGDDGKQESKITEDFLLRHGFLGGD
ncbi:MAG: riboflavin synthase [bacterium]